MPRYSRHRTRHSLPMRFIRRQTVQFLYLGGFINENADIMPDIIRWVRFAWACLDRFKLELYDMETAPFTLKVPTLNAEVMETLLCVCVTWTSLGVENFAVLHSAHRKLLLGILGFVADNAPTTAVVC